MIVSYKDTISVKDAMAENCYLALKKMPLERRRAVIKRHPNFLKILMDTKDIKIYYKTLFLDLDLVKDVKRGREMAKHIEKTAKWVEKLHGDTREKVIVELARQQRALRNYLDGKMPRRTATRIIERSHKRVAWIVAGGYEQ